MTSTINGLESAQEIRRATKRLLDKSGAYGVLPTPIDDLVESAGLSESNYDLFDESLLGQLSSALRRNIKKLSSKVMAAIDRREKTIYLNRMEGTAGAKAFRTLHEVLHDILPWQRELGYADDHLTLSPATNRLFEKEANYGAAELLFQNDYFQHVAADYQISIASVIDVSRKFGSSIHAALRRYVETHRAELLGIVLDPQATVDPKGGFSRKEIVSSSNWAAKFGGGRRFPQHLRVEAYSFLDYALQAQAQPNQVIGATQPFVDLRGDPVDVRVEVLFTTYSILILMWRPAAHRPLRARRILVAPAA